MTGLVFAIKSGDNDKTKNTYDWNFIDEDWSSVDGSISFWRGVKGASYTEIGFSDDFWMPIEDWEYNVCKGGLQSQLNEKKPLVIGGGIYDITITSSANQFVPLNNDSFLYEVSWYVHPNGNHGHTFTVILTGNGYNDVLQESKAGQRRGSQGYSAFYSTKNYTNIKISYDGSTYIYPIIYNLDKNRQ